MSFATDLELTPQAKTVLLHLRKHGKITPMKALVVYGISRLASCIHEIREAGYGIDTIVKRDDQNHRYGEYWMGDLTRALIK